MAVMAKRTILIACALALLATAAQAGAPKPEHPCYEVADCKKEGSRPAFSQCVKSNLDAANANAACAEFRKDKPAYMKKHGIDGLDSLFVEG
jgi:hypothetical protein